MKVTLTQDQEYIVLDGGSLPEPLRDIDVSTPFLYVRGYGVFYVNMGYHTILLAHINAWTLGFEDWVDAQMEGHGDVHEQAEEMIKRGGVALMSNVGGNFVYAHDLNSAEKTYFPPTHPFLF